MLHNDAVRLAKISVENFRKVAFILLRILHYRLQKPYVHNRLMGVSSCDIIAGEGVGLHDSVWRRWTLLLHTKYTIFKLVDKGHCSGVPDCTRASSVQKASKVSAPGIRYRIPPYILGRS